jgi:hypothetical protein
MHLLLPAVAAVGLVTTARVGLAVVEALEDFALSQTRQ